MKDVYRDCGDIMCRVLDDGEHLEAFFTRHWTSYVKIAVMALMMFLFIMALMLAYVLTFARVGIGYDFAWMIFFMLFTAIGLWTMVAWYQDAMDIVAVTDSRLFFHHQISFLQKDSISLFLSQIQDVKATQSGLMAHIFSYGDIDIQTSSEHGSFILEDISGPHYVASQILNIAHRGKKHN